MTKKEFKKKIKKLFKRENIYRTVIAISGLALIATSILPYIL